MAGPNAKPQLRHGSMKKLAWVCLLSGLGWRGDTTRVKAQQSQMALSNECRVTGNYITDVD